MKLTLETLEVRAVTTMGFFKDAGDVSNAV
jgi:hypothetical protein